MSACECGIGMCDGMERTRRLSRAESAVAWYAPSVSRLYAWRASDVCTWCTTDLVIIGTSASHTKDDQQA